MLLTLTRYALWGTLLALPAFAEDIITLPLRFHIAQGAEMTIKAKKLEAWVKPADLKGPVLIEINRIWKQAGIQFVIERAEEEAVIKPADYAEIIQYVENAKRDENGHGDPTRIQKIMQLVDPAKSNPKTHNIYLMPYIGGTSQGNAQFKLQGIFVGTWTDKASRGLNPPVKTLLSEKEPFKVGSLARTIAHEIGHTLGLNHPKSSSGGGAQLMSSGGYVLTPTEITTARKIAQAIKSDPAAAQ